MHVGDMRLYNHEVLTCMFKYTPPGCLWMPYYHRPFVSKLVMSVLCKKWVTSRDELLASRDNCDTSRDYCDTSRDNCDTSRDDLHTLRDS